MRSLRKALYFTIIIVAIAVIAEVIVVVDFGPGLWSTTPVKVQIVDVSATQLGFAFEVWNRFIYYFALYFYQSVSILTLVILT